jgi:protein-L-isoaspartate(D-aspartate) O-methyltransferase
MRDEFETTVALADARREERARMVGRQLRGRQIRSERVLEAMMVVPRHEFVAEEYCARAYEDAPLPIGEGQTISQPYMVASMTEALELTGSERVLEVGTGSGYQAAVLGRLAREVYTIESRAGLALAARERLARLGGYENVHVHAGDGTLGLPELAPFDAILVAAGAPEIPAPLVEQLAEGGRIVVPVGNASVRRRKKWSGDQQLVFGRKVGEELRSVALYPCRFVPLVGRYGWPHGGGSEPRAVRLNRTAVRLKKREENSHTQVRRMGRPRSNESQRPHVRPTNQGEHGAPGGESRSLTTVRQDRATGPACRPAGSG